MPYTLDKESQLARVAEGVRNLFSEPGGTIQSQIARSFSDPSMAALPMGMGFNLPQFKGIVNSLSGRSALPIPENIASWLGGVHLKGPGAEAARLSKTSMGDIVNMMETNPEEAMRIGQRLTDLYKQGFQRVTNSEFYNPSHIQRMHPELDFHGGSPVPQDVWDRAMNAGLRDIILGFGQGTQRALKNTHVGKLKAEGFNADGTINWIPE